MSTSPYQTAVRRSRIVVLIAISILVGLAWTYTVRLALHIPAAMAMPMPMPWSATDYFYMFVMWAVMMVAMMLPSATPAILLFDRVRAHRASGGRPAAATAAFVAGYLLTWTVFSLLATGVNWALHTTGVLSSMMGSVAPSAGAWILIAAGLFQWTPLKQACLVHCRTPMGFLTQHWRNGGTGAVWMGVQHGAYCLGCCWLLMLLLFVLGVMNLVWVLLLTVVVLAEKLLPRGELVSRVLGVLLMGWGLWLLYAV